jgi:hypothetical protein
VIAPNPAKGSGVTHAEQKPQLYINAKRWTPVADGFRWNSLQEHLRHVDQGHRR